MKILLSIKPEFAERIFDGTKRFEFRKVVYANRNVRTVVVYVTRPVGRILGEFEVLDITEGTPDRLWEVTQAFAGVSREFFNEYFLGRDRGYAIHIGFVTRYETPLVPEDLIENFTPPQSYMYLDDRLRNGRKQLELL